jgi:hypothetical protein
MAYQSNQMTRTMKRLVSMDKWGASRAEHDRHLAALQEFREIKWEVAMIKVSNDNQRQDERQVLSSPRLGRRSWR